MTLWEVSGRSALTHQDLHLKQTSEAVGMLAFLRWNRLDMRLPLVRRIQFGFSAVLVVLLVVGIIAYRDLLASAHSDRWVQHTHEVLEHLATLLSAIPNIETGYRGLALTGEETFSQSSRASVALVAHEEMTLRALTADNPGQQRRLATLAALMEQTVRLDETLVRLRQTAGPKAAAQLIETGQGDRILQQSHAVVSDMQVEERRLLLERGADAERRRRQTQAALIFGSVAGLLIATAAAWAVQREFSRRGGAERALLESEERYRVALAGVLDYSIFTLDPYGTVSSWNAGAERIKGYKAAEIIGQNFSRFYPQEDIDQGRPQEELRIAAACGKSERECWRMRKDGSRFWANLLITATRDASGKLVGFSEISRDISARQAADRQLAETVREISREITERKQSEQQLVKTVGELKRSNEELQQFAYVASHDLQEPLRMVASYTQLLAKRYTGRLDHDADEYIAYAVDGCNRMQALIQDLLTYSRAGTDGRSHREISSENALNAALTNLRATIQESGAVVTHDSLPAITMDDTQLVQVFQNLVGNAVKYRSPEIPRVHVTAAKNAGNECVFAVRDNGVGIDPQYFERIFVLFQRLHGQNEFTGTGIGLAICKKIVERLGGRIWVESQPAKGSTFYFALPQGETS